MNKLSLCGLTLLIASSAFAQTTTTTYTSPQTLTVGTCTLTITRLTQNFATNTISVDATSCGTQTPNPSVSLSINPTTYTVGSGAAAPVVTWVPNTAAANAICTLTPPAGITGTQSGNTFILNTPTAVGTYSFAPTCTLTGANVPVSPSSVSLTVSSSGGGGGGGGDTCDPAQTATVGGKTLQRQCSGGMVVYPGATPYSGDLSDLGTVLGGSAWPAYKYRGSAPTFTVQSNHYISLGFTPTVAGTIQFSTNPSFGDGGIISVSTQPGSLLYGSAGVICSATRSGSNSITIGTGPGVDCPVAINQKYYVNFSDVDTSGSNLCNGFPNSCNTATVSYTLYTSK